MSQEDERGPLPAAQKMLIALGVIAAVLLFIIVLIPVVTAPSYVPLTKRIDSITICKGPVIEIGPQLTREYTDPPYVLAYCLLGRSQQIEYERGSGFFG